MNYNPSASQRAMQLSPLVITAGALLLGVTLGAAGMFVAAALCLQVVFGAVAAIRQLLSSLRGRHVYSAGGAIRAWLVRRSWAAAFALVIITAGLSVNATRGSPGSAVRRMGYLRRCLRIDSIH